jgi:hypothetical protein
VVDFNRDGRTDIVATQTFGETQVYLGQAGKAGIRVGFSANNSLARRLGARVRLIYPDGSMSPRRWFHSGDGVMAQCAPEQVLGFVQRPQSVQIEWSDGIIKAIPVESDKNDYKVP